jgi:MFS family permease
VAIGVATILIPFAAVLLALPIPSAPLQPPAPADIGQVLRAVWLPGSALALSGVGFSAVMTFVALLFAGRGWSEGWLAFTILSLAFIAGRATLGHLPDRIGGAKVAIACILVEAAGQALIWLAASPALAFAGVALTGLGYSLVYPGLGVVAVAKAPPRSRGLAMGAYTAFLDVSLGFSGPLLGWLAGGRDLGIVYLAATLAVLCSACVALPLLSGRWRVPDGVNAADPMLPARDCRPDTGPARETEMMNAEA